MRTVLIIGASGVFGSRLAAHLCCDPRIGLVLCARSADKVAALAGSLSSAGQIVGYDAADAHDLSSLQDLLRRRRPWMTVNASGPFTSDRLDMPGRILMAGSHYADIGDDPGFLSGFREAVMRQCAGTGLAAVCGASTTPGITGAVVDALARGWREVEDVDIAICPAGRSDVGPAVVRSVLGTAGREIPGWSEGQAAGAVGWTRGHSITIDGIGRRRVALAAAIDPHRIGRRHGVTGGVRLHAGLESGWEQRGMETIARLVRTAPRSRPERLTPLLHAARTLTRATCGEDGAMRVSVTGRNAEGKRATLAWTLTARSGSGPNVPVMAAAAVVSKGLRNELPIGPAMADDVLSLPEIEAEFARYPITTTLRADP